MANADPKATAPYRGREYRLWRGRGLVVMRPKGPAGDMVLGVSPRILVLTAEQQEWHAARMARKPRVEYEGAVYHAMNRGDRGGKIFKDKRDYEILFQTMTELCEQTLTPSPICQECIDI